MILADTGKLSLGVIWDGMAVRATEIRSTRPVAAQLLKGKTPERVMQIVPLLFSVCGRAQGAAAQAAIQAAQQGGAAVFATMERAIICEALQEHLWRVMLDWPKLLGLVQQEQRFVQWHAMLREIAAGKIDMAVLLHEFERDWLGMPVAEWRELDSYQALQTWWRGAASPAAQLLAKLDEQEHGRQGGGEIRLLPAWTAADAHHACAGRWDAAFSASPDWQGVAAETGAWAYFSDNLLLREVWQQSGSKAMSRLLARIFDMVEMADGNAAPRLDAASPSAGAGITVVRTARGLLMHYVRIAAEQVADYVIVAPTEWNFHPAGAFAQDACGLKERDAERLHHRMRIGVLSLDPCVPYEIGVCHA